MGDEENFASNENRGGVFSAFDVTDCKASSKEIINYWRILKTTK